MPDALPLGSPAPSQPTRTDPADVVPLHEPVQPSLLPEPVFVRVARPSARPRRGYDDHDDQTDDPADHQSERSDQDHRDGRPRVATRREATDARIVRWLVAHVQYDQARAVALVQQHGARRVLDAIYDHVVEWKEYSRGRYGTAGCHRLRASDQWGRPVMNHAGYLAWQLKQG